MKIGNREVIYAAQFLCPQGEHALIEFKYKNADIKVQFKFEDETSYKDSKIISDGFSESTFKIRITNWPPGPGLTTTPFGWAYGTIGKQTLSLAGQGCTLQSGASLFVQFMVEENNE